MIEVKKMQIESKYTDKWEALDSVCVEYIILHHTGSEKDSPNNIHRHHIDNGWYGAGYNAYIPKAGGVIEMRGKHIGAHCKHYNERSFGICLEGNYEYEREMPEVQKDTLIAYLKQLIPMFPNLKDVVGHNQFGNTRCPGKYFPLSSIVYETHATEESKFEDAVMRLKREGVINSPLYWLNAFNTKDYNPVYVELLIKKVADFLGKNYNNE